MSDLTPETLAEIVKDDVRFWLSNPFMTPELLAGKVCAWVDRALAAEKAAREEADRYAALQTETLRTSEALVKRHAAGEAEQRLRAVKAEQEREAWRTDWIARVGELERELTRSRAIHKEDFDKLSGYVKAWGPMTARAEVAEARVAELEAGINAEIDHAAINGHVLDRDCQGVAPGEKVPAVRASSLRAVIEKVVRRG